jgi:multidrug efflux pump subunit AcrB
LAPARWILVTAYAAVTIGIVVAVGLTLGREIFPAGGVSQFQLRFRAPAGTKFESTERLATDVLNEINQAAGPNNVEITLGYVGVQPSSYPINTIFLWTGGPHEGVLQVALKPDAGIRLTDFQETLRRRFSERFPTAQFSFEPGDIVNRIMNFGTSTPVEVAIMGPDFAASRTFAAKVREELARIPALRDLQYGQALDYPAIQVNVNRQMAGQLGVTVDQVGRSFAAATSSSRFVTPNYWADPRTGIAFQVQIQVPQPQMTTLDDLRVVPVSGDRGSHALLGDVANIGNATIVGEYDRINGQRMVTLTANVAGQDLGRTVGQVDQAIARGNSAAWRDGGRARPDRRHARDLHKHYRRAGCRGRRDLSAAGCKLSVAPSGVRRRLDRACRTHGRGVNAGGHAHDTERAVVHGRHHGHRRRRGQRHPARDVCRAVTRGGYLAAADGHRRGTLPHAARVDDECRDDRRHDSYGTRLG